MKRITLPRRLTVGVTVVAVAVALTAEVKLQLA